jgi:hypothetical protein
MSEDAEPVYSDGLSVGCAPFTVSLLFTISNSPNRGNQPPRVVADIRMSPEHAKVMAIILRRQLKDFEEQLGKAIPIHPHVSQQLGLSPMEDW